MSKISAGEEAIEVCKVKGHMGRKANSEQGLRMGRGSPIMM